MFSAVPSEEFDEIIYSFQIQLFFQGFDFTETKFDVKFDKKQLEPFATQTIAVCLSKWMHSQQKSIRMLKYEKTLKRNKLRNEEIKKIRSKKGNYIKTILSLIIEVHELYMKFKSKVILKPSENRRIEIPCVITQSYQKRLKKKKGPQVFNLQQIQQKTTFPLLIQIEQLVAKITQILVRVIIGFGRIFCCYISYQVGQKEIGQINLEILITNTYYINQLIIKFIY
ncbi:unnamed protein product (macronuclear) [Paramecium tetraurelia]|uniref:Transmembrane protein n=1 Tax=Paramecium tetraurelia TaxID=5888 RepID=A0C281_PARTE|nr:uncharacterized protein GSPATT00034375001 [Paramecium tetraurelia]CAK64898.1 unnamed protein product [Paramecium tetraurelia]|eukprot:XP_001432295.1 hypothetical protein (macronuclear) [Paramecium tetraurelia strain d4-2]